MRRTFRRVAVILGLATATLFVVASPASAHVTVNPNVASQGDYTTVAFRVPNEKDSATTVKVAVYFPTDTPIASVAVKPVPGWTAETQSAKLATPITTDDGQVTEAISQITWTATGSAAIQPGQFEEFEVSLGPLPKTNQVVFKALQTYSDGDVVRWIDLPNADGSEPEHPAPVLHLTAASTGDVAAPAPAQAATAGTSSGGTGSAGLIWGIIGTVLGAAGLIISLLGFRAAKAGRM